MSSFIDSEYNQKEDPKSIKDPVFLEQIHITSCFSCQNLDYNDLVLKNKRVVVVLVQS